MIAEILSGVLLGLGFVTIILHTRNKSIKVGIGGWVLIGFALGFSIFVIELIASFIREGTPQAALVMGGIFGFVAIIIWVLIGRFILSSKSKRND